MSIQAQFSFTDGSAPFTLTGNNYQEVLSKLVDKLPPGDKKLINIPASKRAAKRGKVTKITTPRMTIGKKHQVGSSTIGEVLAKANALAYAKQMSAAALAEATARPDAERGATTRSRAAANQPSVPPGGFAVHRPSSKYASRGPATGVPGNPWNDPRRGPPGCPHPK